MFCYALRLSCGIAVSLAVIPCECIQYSCYLSSRMLGMTNAVLFLLLFGLYVTVTGIAASSAFVAING